jgi:hypothetical protein
VATDPAALSGAALWLRAKDLGANNSSALGWVNQINGIAGLTRAPVATQPPLVKTGATPSAGKAVEWPVGGTMSSPGQATTSSIDFGPIMFTGTDVAVIYASSYYDEPAYAISRIIDGNAATEWLASSPTTTVTVRLISAKTVTAYTLTCSNNSRAPKTWTFEASNDGSSWTTLDTQSTQTFSGSTPRTFSFSNATPYLYYRLNITANNEGSQYITIHELTFTGATLIGTMASAGEIWAVVKAPTTNASLWQCGPDGSYFTNVGAGTIYESWGLGAGAGFVSQTPVKAVAATWRLYRVFTNGAFWTSTIDSTIQNSKAAAAFWRPYMVVGGQYFTAVQFGGGQVAEIYARRAVSTMGETADLIAYFNSEHGLTVPGPGPESLSNKTLWLRAKDLTGANGSAQTAWTDQSGKGNNVSGMTGSTLETAGGPASTPALRAVSAGIGLATPAVFGLVGNTDLATTHSDSQGSYPSSQLVDGSLTGFGWATNAAPTVGTPQWVRFQPTVPTVVTNYQIYPAITGTTRTPKDWTFQGSMDGSAWTTLDTRTGITSWPSLTIPNSYSFSNTTAWTYYRLLVTANNSDIIHWQEVTLNGVANVANQGAELWLLVQLVVSDGGAWAFGSSGQDNHFTYQGSVYNDFGNAVRRSYVPTLTMLANWRLLRLQITRAGVISDYFDNVEQQRVTGVTPKWGTTAKLSAYWNGRFAEALLIPNGTTYAQKQMLTTYYNSTYGLSVPAPTASPDDLPEPTPATPTFGFWGILQAYS